MRLLRCSLLIPVLATALLAEWLPPSATEVQITKQADGTSVIRSDVAGEFTLESERRLEARAGDTFEVTLRIRADEHTRALPELVCYDKQGREIPVPPSLATGPTNFRTVWESVSRVFAVRPGTASVRARLRVAGRGELSIGGLEFRRKEVDTYQTGALISQIFPFRRQGLVLDANLGVVNRERISPDDRDGDGKWALILVDLDDLSAPGQLGEDWYTSLRYRPNELYWFDGAVLKSDSVTAARAPGTATALHFRERVHPGSYRAIMNDPGRAVAVSVDGKTWTRFEGGAEVELGTLDAPDGVIELWVDAPYRDPISQGPVYFDYVRLFAKDHAPSADRLFKAAKQAPGKLERGSVDEKRVALSVQAPRSAGGRNWPVRCGLPIPKGELASAHQATVLDAKGNAVPSQNRVTATWPDGSVKWLYLDFQQDLSAGGGRYSLAYGNRVKAKEPASRVTVRETGGGMEVDTGSLRFRVPKERFGILDNVTLASGKRLQTEPAAISITEADGKTWRALDLPVETLTMEEVGPLHAVIRVETRLAPSGKPASGFYHRARIHAYAGSPLVQVDYFVANTDSRDAGVVAGSMASLVKVRSIVFSVKPDGAIAGPAGELIQKTADQPHNVPGWIALDLKSNGSIHAGVEAFREQFPKAFRWGPGGLDIALWAEEGGEYEWYEGVGKTHRISLYYSDGKPSDASLLAHEPVLAVAEPAWYSASGAFGPIVTAAESGLPKVEKVLEENMRGPMIDEVGLGFENYGDHASAGYVKGSRAWDNKEYDAPAGAIVHFARTGDLDALRVGLAGALHYLDVDTIHYSSEHADWVGACHVHSHRTNGHHTIEGPNMAHAGYTQGLIWYSYLTGEPVGILGAQGIAEWVLRNIAPEKNAGAVERSLGHSLMTLTDVYEATWDDRYLGGAARLVDWGLKKEHPAMSGLRAPGPEGPAYYSGAPGVGAGIAHAGLIKFNSWARLPEVDGLIERLARFTLTFQWRPPAGLVSKGTFRGARGEAFTMAENMRVMAHAYGRTGDPLFLAVPMVSVEEAFVTKPRRIGTRSTGRVYTQLPWFLTTLHRAGNPELDKELSVTAGPMAIAKGGGAEITVRVRNNGSGAVTGLRSSFQTRLDFEVTALGEPPETIPPGGEAEFRYRLRAPERINLTHESNRIAYAHWSGVFERAGHKRLGHGWTRIEVTSGGNASLSGVTQPASSIRPSSAAASPSKLRKRALPTPWMPGRGRGTATRAMWRS